MKYLVRCCTAPGLILGEANSVDEAEKLIDSHINKLYFPTEAIKLKFRRNYKYHEIVKEETKITDYWAVSATYCLIDGKLAVFHGAPQRIRSDYEYIDRELKVLYRDLRKD